MGNDTEVKKLAAVDIQPIVNSDDAAILREYADQIERGEIRQYAFTAQEVVGGRFLYSHASSNRAALVGILYHHLSSVDKGWSGE